MSEQRDSHVEDRIQACLDGELSPREEAKIHAHMKNCEACTAIWTESVGVCEILSADHAGDPIRPVWPSVRRRLREERSSRTGIAFRLGASFAAAAGLLIGLYMGSIDLSGGIAGTETDKETWSEFGSLLGMESDGSLDNLFLSADDEEGESL